MDESWRRARAFAEGQRWLVTAGQARAVGLLPAQIDSAIRRGELLALMRGVYLVDADMYPDLPMQTWWHAALLAHGPKACLVARTAARAQGAQGLPVADSEIDIAIVGGASRPPRGLVVPGRPSDGPVVVVRQWSVCEDEIDVVDGLRARHAARSVVDAALLLDRVHALCLFDWALRADIHSHDSLTGAVAQARRRPGVAHVKAVVALADGRAASPLESRVRLACVDGGVAPDDLQYVVRNRWDDIVAVGDLAWFKRRARPLIAEADGEDPHSRPRAVLHDRRRGNALIVQMCDVVRFTWEDSLRPRYIQQVVKAALAC